MERLIRQTAAVLTHYFGVNAVLNRRRQLTLGPRLVVLAYHRVNDLPGDDSPYTVRSAQLERQLEIVARRFRIVGFQDVQEMAAGRTKCVDSAVITFDDGYQDNHEIAAPILEKRGMTGCFFLATKMIEDASRPGDGVVDRPELSGMNWEQVRDLHSRGFELGAHTRNHPTLPAISLEEARREITQSKEEMQEALGAPVRYFAYPGGKKGDHYNDAIKGIVEGEFDLCCTTNRGRNSLRNFDTQEIRRICVQRWWSPFYFARELDGVFDIVGSHTFTSRKG